MTQQAEGYMQSILNGIKRVDNMELTPRQHIAWADLLETFDDNIWEMLEDFEAENYRLNTSVE